MTKRELRFLLFCFLVLFLGAIQVCPAQTLYGTIVGNVKDASQATVAGATVTLINTATQQVREATTNETGGYDFATLPPGTYVLKVSKEGFNAYTRNAFAVVSGTTERVDVNLTIGAVSESVTVSGQVAELQTDRAEVASEVSSSQLENLPMSLGRNYQTVFVTLPGFGGITSSYNSTPSNPSKALVFNVNGASFNINNTKIDGAQSINPWLPHESAYVPTLEAVEAVNVVTNSFDAETGLAGGAAIYVNTKSGTNDIHGAAFAEHDNQHLNARPFFLPATQAKQKFVYNDFGGAAGGRFIRDKLFWFGSFEQTDDREGAFYLATVPTAAIKSGNETGQNNLIYDPLTGNTATGAGRTPFPNQTVPTARIDPIAAQLAGMTPLPNLGANLLASNYFFSAPFIFDRTRADAKLNWNPTSKLSTFVRFGMLHYNMENPPVFGNLGGVQVASQGGNPGHGWGNTWSLTFAGTYLISPTFVADAYVGWSRLGTAIEIPGLNSQAGLALGIPGTNGSAHYQGGLPRFAVSSYDDIGTESEFLPYYREDPATNYVINFDKTRGSHDIRWGVDLSQVAMNHIQAEGGTAAGMGGFLFNGGPTSIPGGASSNQFNSYSTFLLGMYTNSGKNTIYAPNVGCPESLCGAITTRQWRYGLYIRDRWNATPKLTVSYGLRWEYYPLPRRADQGIGLYNVDTNLVDICGYGLVPKNCNIKLSNRLFAPRLGIAYRVSSSFVIRAGYGITYDPYSLDRPFKYNYPTLLIATFDQPNSYAALGTLEQGIPAIQLPSYGNGTLSIPGSYATSTTSNTSFQRGYIQSWNFTMQKELRYGFVGQAGYVATRATDMLNGLNVNAGQLPGLGTPGEPLYQQYGRAASTLVYEPVGTNQYNSLQARLERHFVRGFQFAANYTWSKAIGISANDDTTLKEPAYGYWNMNRAVQSYDRTHNLSLQGMWELPFGKGRSYLNRNAFASAVLGGWRFNSITSFLSGLPFSVSASGTSLNMPSATQRANQILPNVQILGNIGSTASYFNPLAFGPVTTATFGNAGFYSLRGPGDVMVDLGLSRDFPIKEKFKAQFRFEAFNFLNTPHFGLPSTNVSNMVMNGDGTIKNLGGYSTITGTQNLGRDFDERHIQFYLRFSF